ncbi:Pyrophosphatase [Leptospira biflexa serovar Patoc strain 'Patoc 1 (Ames)']|uniref:Putative nucleoside triphosphate pyrophosphohydrolase and pyrophosphatase MazG n=1 Tax=Leptospira biflexa serovar Patoc (strain Patoc 1 / ATCC 23582 / Paris) TaxID=456481 RepID=B0SKN0_LEPBP|nr:nucleoside triphosphate pyrophosphohydrolase [Leptospira biflexa]ABZ93164.1 Pyrophosphatase [Leptospira biflexa serovar Patoc strain 'Patoc 1 (Ames)']ABZ96787.1 Putative nucleoside triphosphate pyrophosphohydrolase and pyrophosphatase MazG [Leptospira biflexa serovar Patoc strain 'Patoc 1 (Paris)']
MNPPNFDSPIQNLLQLTSDLRSPEGCPWDKEQTHRSVIPHLLEETYEVVDTIEKGDDNHLKEELGDLLFQITFHSQLAKERGAFDFQDVASGVFQKLVYRHPHVYGNKAGIGTGEEVLTQWDQLKQKEKESKGILPTNGSLLSEIPKALPAIQRSEKIQSKVTKQGFDWPNVGGVFQKFQEEIQELDTELQKKGSLTSKKLPYDERIEDELGDLFFLLVNLSRKLSIDPETCLRRANEKFESRFRLMEGYVAKTGKTLKDHSLEELDTYWDLAKEELRVKFLNQNNMDSK